MSPKQATPTKRKSKKSKTKPALIEESTSVDGLLFEDAQRHSEGECQIKGIVIIPFKVIELSSLKDGLSNGSPYFLRVSMVIGMMGRVRETTVIALNL